MPPRFVNPHFLPDSSITVSRREIYAETEGTDDEGILKPDPQLVNQLKELIYTVWDPQVDYEPRKSKRRRIQSPPCVQEEVPIAFRLVSSTKPPQPILLRPKTPPPPKTREPEIEDNEEQAALRAERAKAIAVDGSYILAGSHDAMPCFTRTDKPKRVRTTTPLDSAPVIMAVDFEQPPRSTRPPVPSSLLQHHPYNNGPTAPSQSRVSASHCPVVEVTPISSVESNTSKRRRKRKQTRDRPTPAFWRPNPAVGGKCLGYAMGFPCSIEALQNGVVFTSYPRDTMRKFGPAV